MTGHGNVIDLALARETRDLRRAWTATKRTAAIVGESSLRFADAVPTLLGYAIRTSELDLVFVAEDLSRSECDSVIRDLAASLRWSQTACVRRPQEEAQA